jgi:tetratricopeptide (TPR) repeat protein
VLRKIVDHRDATNSLNDEDADRSVQHLVDLLVEGKRYAEAEQLLTKLLNNPSLSQSTNPQAYAANLERLALCHIATAQYQQAEGELTLVASLKESSGANKISLAKTFEAIGDLYRSQGKRGDAQSYYKRLVRSLIMQWLAANRARKLIIRFIMHICASWMTNSSNSNNGG